MEREDNSQAQYRPEYKQLRYLPVIAGSRKREGGRERERERERDR